MIDLRYDKNVDAAYLSLGPIADGEIVRTAETQDGVLLDFDEAGRLRGIEILGASRTLPADALAASSASR